MKLKLENGKSYTPKDSDPIRCELHDVTVKWGDLTPIQQLAVEANLDIDGPCILLPENKGMA